MRARRFISILMRRQAHDLPAFLGCRYPFSLGFLELKPGVIVSRMAAWIKSTEDAANESIILLLRYRWTKSLAAAHGRPSKSPLDRQTPRESSGIIRSPQPSKTTSEKAFPSPHAGVPHPERGREP